MASMRRSRNAAALRVRRYIVALRACTVCISGVGPQRSAHIRQPLAVFVNRIRDRAAMLANIERRFFPSLCRGFLFAGCIRTCHCFVGFVEARSEEHTSELQSLMRISYAVF